MGVDRTTHVVFGWKLPEPMIDANGEEINPYEDEFLPYVEGHKGVKEILIHDQMMGEYNVFGIHLASPNEGDFEIIETESLNAQELRETFKSVFGIDAPTEDPKIIAFIHCS